MSDKPKFLQGYAEGLASRLGGDDAPILLSMAEVLSAVAGSAGIKCPNCNDQGFTPRQIDDDEWEQEQCEFCYCVSESVFNRAQA